MSDIKKGYTFTDKSTDWASNKETAIRLNKMMDEAKVNLVAGANVTITPTINGPQIDVAGSGTGNVIGPASATDNALARFDGTTGKLIQNSVVTVDDTTGNMAGVGTLTVGGALTYGGVTLTNNVTGTGKMVLDSSPILVTPNLGTPSTLVGTNITGTASGLTAGTVTTNANLTGDVTSVGNATSIASNVIVDADINSSAAIADTKLATIATALKVSNSATTATSANTASAIVARDASGNFSAGTITASLSGNATNVTGTVAIANGGTGQTTANTAFNALAPSQATNSGKYLTTNGTNTSWAALGSNVPVGVANRAALRAYTGAVDKQFIVEAAYGGTPGDGGGGLWQFVAGDNYSVDNDGTLVVPGGVYSTPATAGCWHRVGVGTQGLSVVTGTKLDVRWFGAIPDKGTDCAAPFVRAFNSLKVLSSKLDGAIYAPAGYYAFYNNMLFDATGLDIKTAFIGDGPSATVFYNSLTTSGLSYFMKFVGFDNLSLSGFTVQKITITPPTYNPDAIIHIKNGQSVHVNNVDGRDNVGTTFLWEATEGGTWLQMSGCKTYGTSNVGTQLKCMGGAGTVTGCSFKTSYSTPCLWVNSCNSIQISDSFFEGGGPWKSFSSTITGSGSAFTVNATSHGFRVGDYIVISSSTVGGYNGRWKVASVTTNSLTVTSTVTGSATATLGTLWSCGLLGGTAGGNVTESSIDNCLFNTSGSPGTGSVGLYLDGRDTTPVSGIRISQCTWDYGVTGFFAHGITNQASNVLGATVYNSNVSLIYVNACGPNGGPRDEFGAFRLEGVTSITINDCACFPTDNNPPGTGKTFNSLVISDGGQSYYTQDISITGGTYTVPYSSSLFPSASIYAFVFDGANVRRVNIAGVGVDTLYSNAYVSSFINGATVSNGIALLYSDKNGNLLFVGTNSSSGANVLASNVMGKCAYAQKSANQSIPNSSFTAVTFDNLIFDDASIWSSGANTRLTVPSNVSRVRVASNVSFASNSTGYRYVAIVKNGSSRIASQLQLADRNSQINICSPTINVASGDYFEFFLEQNTGGALDVLATAETAFSLEIIK